MQLARFNVQLLGGWVLTSGSAPDPDAENRMTPTYPPPTKCGSGQCVTQLASLTVSQSWKLTFLPWIAAIHREGRTSAGLEIISWHRWSISIKPLAYPELLIQILGETCLLHERNRCPCYTYYRMIQQQLLQLLLLLLMMMMIMIIMMTVVVLVDS